MRIALTIVALVLDSLCLALCAFGMLSSETSASGRLGLAIIAVVVLANFPALIWSLVLRKPADASAAAAGIFS